jgi:uncharacterized protein (TIRG00374 family)
MNPVLEAPGRSVSLVDGAQLATTREGPIKPEVNERPPAQPEVVVEPLASVPDVRRAADVLRLILALAVLLVGLLVATLADAGVRSTERGLLETIVTLPASLRDSLTTAVQLMVVVIPAAVVVVMMLRRRFAAVAKLVVAGAVALVAGVLVSHLLLGDSHPPTWHELLTGRNGIVAVTLPPVAWLAAMTAVVAAAGGELSRRWRRGLWWLTGIAGAVEVMVGGFLPVDAVVAAALGISLGSLVLLIFGEPARRPTAAQVVAALEDCGVDVASLKQLPSPGEGPDRFRATTRDGIGLAVRVYADDDRDHDRLARLTRWLLVRDPQDDRAGVTVESAAEHELLAMVAAARAGGRVPEPVVAYPVAGGPGPTGALVSWMDVDGQRLDLVSADEVREATLADIWLSVSRLHQHRVAHRRLRPDNITVDGSGQAWLTGLVLAELGANDRQLATDVAELMVSLAAQIGVDRTVASAVAELGGPTVAASAAFVQPLAVSAATRATVRDYDHKRSDNLSHGIEKLRPGGRPSLYADLRTAVAQVTGEPAVKPEQLARFTWKKGLTLLGAFAVIYLLLPQLANAGAAVHALQHANWWWVLAALPALFVAQSFSTLLQLGAIPADLPFGPTYFVSLGGSFLNRVTPNNVGGMALNFRYQQKAGIDSGAASAAVGLETIVGLGANLLLLAVFAARTGRNTSVHFHFHVHQWVLVLITAALVGCGLYGLTPRGRRFFHDKIWGFIRSAGTAIADVAKSPRHLALVGVGALGGPMVQITSLWLCVHALGGHVPFVEVGAVYLGGHLVASAAPVPGGLGALEAALIAGLSALGMPVGAAASAVLIYRLLTYWLTIPVGWLSLKIAEERRYV